MLLPLLASAQAPVEDLGSLKPASTPSLQTAPAASKQKVVEDEIVDISARSAVNSNPGQTVLSKPVVETSPKTANAEMFYQLQTLQQEVQSLRGTLEQQQFEINKLKQQRLDDYIDLDRRIGELSAAATPVNKSGSQPAASGQQSPINNAASPTSSSTNSSTMASQAAPAPGFNPADEAASYEKAYAFLKQRQVDDSMKAFEKHLQLYPEGDYAANALYWLGELHLLRNDTSLAEKQFSDLLARFPAHRKADDARFKLAKVYFQQGKIDSSRQLLEALIQENNDVSRLASSFLESNF